MRAATRFVGSVVVPAVLLAAGCGASASDECHPSCGPAFECFYGICVPRSGDAGGGDADVPDRADDGDVVDRPETPPDVPGDTEAHLCTPDDLRCSADERSVERCRADGESWEATPCPSGCVADPTPRCTAWAISNIPDFSLLSAGATPAVPWDVPAAGSYYLVFNTIDGSVALWDAAWTFVADVRAAGAGLDASSGISFTTLAQGGGAPELAVFSFQRLAVPVNLVLTATGPRALVLLSEEDATIAGGVFVGCSDNWNPPIAGGRESGVGPGTGGSGSSLPVPPSSTRDGGGGGGAFGGGGGIPGGYTAALRGAAGFPYGAVELIPLESGSGGGWGGGTTPDGRRGGTSGGATEIVSGGTLAVSGWVDARGCGGVSTYYGVNEAGGGGGSGGGILLEAPHIVVAGSVTANGGGGASGGEGASDGSSEGVFGGIAVGDPASGGVAATIYACGGGAGSSVVDAAGQAAPSCSGDLNLYNAGGGGGGAGRIRINGTTRDFSGLLSPAFVTGAASEGPLALD
jgi:hypothetical protein